jgi:DNA-binding MarR family transcriptional regulator
LLSIESIETTTERIVMSAKLTDNERLVINEFNEAKPRYTHWDNGYKSEDSGTYLSTFAEEVAVILDKPVKSAKGVISSLVKKEYLKSTPQDASEEHEGDHWVELTDSGVELIADVRLEEDEAMLNMDDDDALLVIEDEDDEEHPMQTKSIASLAADARIKEAREGLKKAAQEDIAMGRPHLRTTHADCGHAIHGKEGKQARAKCRRERAAKAAAEAKAQEEANA